MDTDPIKKAQKKKYCVAVLYTISVEADNERLALNEAQFKSIYDAGENLHGLSMEVIREIEELVPGVAGVTSGAEKEENSGL